MRKKNWPDGLYERRGGYFSWRNPLTGEEIGIGRVTFAEACTQAIEANLHVRDLKQKPRLIDRLTGAAGRSVAALVDAYDARLERRVQAGDMAAVTLKQLRSYARAVKKAWAERPAETITTRDAAELLSQWKDAGQDRSAQGARSFGLDLFRHAEAEGWIPRGTNPFSVTEKITAKVRRARLTFEHFQVIYDAAGALEPWVRRSMELALVSAQRREDLFAAEFRRQPASLVWVADRSLYVIQHKVRHSTGMKLRLPFELGLNVLGWSLEDVIGRCRDNVVSPWLLHHTKGRGKQCQPGDQVWIDTITKGFRRARERSGLTWPDQDPPTFNELRSLAARLYKDQGNVDVQALLGHTDPATTRIYTDPKGTKWADIKVA